MRIVCVQDTHSLHRRHCERERTCALRTLIRAETRAGVRYDFPPAALDAIPPSILREQDAAQHLCRGGRVGGTGLLDEPL